HSLSRAAFLTGMAQVQQVHHQGLLRIKGVIGFAGESVPCAVHGVHRDLYPPEPLAGWPAGLAQSRLVCIVRDLDPGVLQALLRQALGQPPGASAPEDNKAKSALNPQYGKQPEPPPEKRQPRTA